MTEHLRARKWRERAGLSIADLAEATGYSTESIYLFEKGFSYDTRGAAKNGEVRTKDIRPQVFQRYRMACAGVAYSLRGRKFNW